MSKPTVTYRTDRYHNIVLGQPAIVVPYAHPSDRVTGDGQTVAITSRVTALGPKGGEFSTENTHYVPHEWDEHVISAEGVS